MNKFNLFQEGKADSTYDNQHIIPYSINQENQKQYDHLNTYRKSIWQKSNLLS